MKKNRFPVMMIALAAAALLGITVWVSLFNICCCRRGG